MEQALYRKGGARARTGWSNRHETEQASWHVSDALLARQHATDDGPFLRLARRVGEHVR